MNTTFQAMIRPQNPARLSDRELVVLALLMDGVKDAAIGVELGIHHKTVQRHREAIYLKFGVHTLLDVARACLHCEYIDTQTFLKPLKQIRNGPLKY